MEVELNAHEARVLGVLIEKAFTTPEQYPLTLNAATTGSNQKSNRDPVVFFSEAEVTVAFQGLQMKQLAGSSFPSGSRVEKWRHNAKEHFALGDIELGVLTELLLRGPQSPGELRARASRMRPIASLDELMQTLSNLTEKGFVERLPPAPGSRAERYKQLLARALHPDGEDAVPETGPRVQSAAPAPAPAPAPTPAPSAPSSAGLAPRVESLEEEVARLRRQLDQLADRLGEALEN